MGNMKDYFKDMQDERKERHAQWKESNTEIIVSSGLPYREANNGETLIFTFPKRCEFFPSTGRWKCHDPKRMMSGGAKAFLKWLQT